MSLITTPSLASPRSRRPILAAEPFTNPEVGAGRPTTPESFGAKGDGLTDDHAAFRRLCDWANAKQHNVRIQLRDGATYYIGQLWEGPTSGARVDQSKWLNFVAIHGLTIEGAARISFKGNYVRTADRTGLWLQFTLCNNVILRGFEVNGNVDQTINPLGLTEAAGSNVLLAGCQSFHIKDIYTHHSRTDGIIFAPAARQPYTPCRDGYVSNVRSFNNARNNITIASLYNCSFIDCLAKGAGITGGIYGGHAPRAGTDVEPDYFQEGVDIQKRTGRLFFYRCGWAENIGAAFNCAYSQRLADEVELHKCWIRNETGYSMPLIFTAPKGRIEGGTYNLGTGSANFTWSGTDHTSNVAIEDAEFIGTNSSEGIRFLGYPNRLTVRRTRQILLKGAGRNTRYFPRIAPPPGSKVIWEDNSIAVRD